MPSCRGCEGLLVGESSSNVAMKMASWPSSRVVSEEPVISLVESSDSDSDEEEERRADDSAHQWRIVGEGGYHYQ